LATFDFTLNENPQSSEPLETKAVATGMHEDSSSNATTTLRPSLAKML
jgi:hypothetical protein